MGARLRERLVLGRASSGGGTCERGLSLGVEVEIIPGSVESLVVSDIVKKLVGMRTVEVVDAVSGAVVDPDTALMDGKFLF